MKVSVYTLVHAYVHMFLVQEAYDVDCLIKADFIFKNVLF